MDGDRIAILGTPSRDQARRAPDAIVWLGELTETPSEFEPIYSEEDTEPGTRRGLWDSFAAGIGSIRFLPNGDLIVSLGFRPEVLRLSSSGKVVDRWRLADLDDGAGFRPFSGFAQGDPGSSRRDQILRWTETTLLVDDVLAIGKTPALVVREPGERGPTWSLVLLEPAGPAWFRIPVPSPAATDRLKADARGDTLAFLGADRGSRARETAVSGQRVLILRSPYP